MIKRLEPSEILKTCLEAVINILVVHNIMLYLASVFQDNKRALFHVS